MRKTISRAATFLVLTCVLLCFSQRVRADNTACAGAILLVPDGSPHEGTFTAIGTSPLVSIRGQGQPLLLASSADAGGTPNRRGSTHLIVMVVPWNVQPIL